MCNKRGDGYIITCVMVIVLCMLITVFITFVSAVNTIRITEKNSRIVLDSYVMENSIINYDSIKNGNDYTEALNEEIYIESLCDFCTLEKNGDLLYSYSEDGSINYKLSMPTVSFTVEDTLKIYTEYTIYVPIRFGGVTINTTEIPIKVESKFNEKF